MFQEKCTYSSDEFVLTARKFAAGKSSKNGTKAKFFNLISPRIEGTEVLLMQEIPSIRHTVLAALTDDVVA